MTSYYWERSITTIDLTHTVSKINGNVSLKSQNCPPPVYLTPLLRRLPLEFGNTGWPEGTRMVDLSG